MFWTNSAIALKIWLLKIKKFKTTFFSSIKDKNTVVKEVYTFTYTK